MAGKRIYLDNNATTRVDPRVRAAMLPFLGAECGNPSSIHALGRRARQAVDKARERVAKLLNAPSESILFTAGGSEADNLALKGAAIAYRSMGDHIVAAAVEHPAVLGAYRFLAGQGFRVTYLPVDPDGRPDHETLRRAITSKTILVSVMLANNETGTLLPVKELAAAARGKKLRATTASSRTRGCSSAIMTARAPL